MGLLSSLFLIYVLSLAPAGPGTTVGSHTIKTSLQYALDRAEPQGDDALGEVRAADRAVLTPEGKLGQLAAQEHLRRAGVYMTNRAFTEARAHFQAVIERYPTDPLVSSALYGLGRSYFQDRRYEESIPFFERLAREFSETKDGREGLYSLASAYLRMGRAVEAVEQYRVYTEKYPQGERVEAAYLNVVDGLREAGQPAEAITWIARTRERFPNTATDKNAVFARLRLDIAARDWAHAVETANQLFIFSTLKGTATSADELFYLRGLSLERLGRKEEAINNYMSVTDSPDSYYGWLASDRLMALADAQRRPSVVARMGRTRAQASSNASQYPAQYREIILREANKRGLDPRLILSIMKQESGFRPRAKSIAAARGLLQLTIDTALRYAARAGYSNVREDDLYRPEVNIAIAAEYIAELKRLFPDLQEAVVASYNGGEDNAARWLKRSAHRDPAIFASEVGFTETKGYVFKVISNYRTYQQLYTKELIKQ
ncbi:MAG TPA: transglycosylase SLT domain-containing protein [Pyrinomonadaceae bacterium]|nr:transglycosylase SLT domain-containing protein [Pyrinomonadaceae bacterium]